MVQVEGVMVQWIKVKGFMTNNRSIAYQSIFGEYHKDEDRVTAALLQILRIGGSELMHAVFDDLDINFEAEVNAQVKGQTKSRPDGELKANYHLFIESKIDIWKKTKHNLLQLQNHITLAQTEKASLLYITVDQKKTADIAIYPDVYWTNWQEVVTRLKNYKSDFNNEVMSFLANQFEILIDNVVFSKNDGYTKNNRVIIVGGHFAEDVACKYHFYSCQPNRKFREASYIAFYHQKRIKYVFKIKSIHDVESLEEVQNILPNYYVLTDVDKEPHTFFELEDADVLPHIVEHKQFGPFVQRQRYTSIEKLRKAACTDDL